MRILLLTSARAWGGAVSIYGRLGEELSLRGHEAHLVTAAEGVASRVADRLPVTEIPGRDSGVRQMKALLLVLRRTRAQAVLVDTPRDLRLSALATLFHRSRLVSRYSLHPSGQRARLSDRVCLSRVAACVYQSRYIREVAENHLPSLRAKPAYQVPNGYDTTVYAPRPEEGRRFRERLGIPSGVHVVLTHARLVAGKGHEVAMAALDRIRREGVSLFYVVCGEGDREGELRALAAALDLPVVFTGLLGADQVVAALAAADVVVHPSLREIFPNAVGEAMACGRPVVATDAGGTAELIGGDAGAAVLVPPGEVERLADAVGALLADPGRRASLGAAARRRIETEFPLSRMIDGYERALGEVVGRERGSLPG